MDKWDIVVVIIALFGLIAAIVGPLIKVSKTMTRLIVTMENVTGKLSELTDKNTKSHQRLWDKNEEQDDILKDHETRIDRIEHAR